jgi:hypothetical protein
MLDGVVGLQDHICKHLQTPSLAHFPELRERLSLVLTLTKGCMYRGFLIFYILLGNM